MARLVYKGKKIKQHAGGVSFTRDVPREVAVESLSAQARAQIEDDPDITEASVKAKPGPTDAEVVLDTPGYEPPAGHELPSPVVKKVERKKRASRD